MLVSHASAFFKEMMLDFNSHRQMLWHWCGFSATLKTKRTPISVAVEQRGPTGQIIHILIARRR